MTVVTISNQKGGVGKTTTAANLGVLLAHRDPRVLVMDSDPQFALTRQLGVEERSLGVNLVDVLASRAAAADAIIRDVYGVDVIAAAPALAGLDMSLVGELEVHPIPEPRRGRLGPPGRGRDQDAVSAVPGPRGRPSCSRRLCIEPKNVLCQHLS
jgi:cellulose biosynthesis protein BcsQ